MSDLSVQFSSLAFIQSQLGMERFKDCFNFPPAFVASKISCLDIDKSLVAKCLAPCLTTITLCRRLICLPLSSRGFWQLPLKGLR